MFIARADSLSGASPHPSTQATASTSSDDSSRQAVGNGFSDALGRRMDESFSSARSREATRRSENAEQTDEDVAAGVLVAGDPATGMPATGLPATGMPATGMPATEHLDARLPANGNSEDSSVTINALDATGSSLDLLATSQSPIAAISDDLPTGRLGSKHPTTKDLRVAVTSSERPASDESTNTPDSQAIGRAHALANRFARNLDLAHQVANTMAALARGQEKVSTDPARSTSIQAPVGSAPSGAMPVLPRTTALRLASQRSIEGQSLQWGYPASDVPSRQSKSLSLGGNGRFSSQPELGSGGRASYDTAFTNPDLATPDNELIAFGSGRGIENSGHHAGLEASRMAATLPLALRSGYIVPPFGHPAWSQEIGRQVVSWAAGLHSGDMHAELHLVPPDIGPLRVQLAIIDGVTTASFTSAHAGVRAALELSMPQLHLSMAQAGVTLGHTHVEDAQAGSGSAGAPAQDTNQHGPGHPGGDTAEDGGPLRNGNRQSGALAAQPPGASQDRNPHRILDVFA